MSAPPKCCIAGTDGQPWPGPSAWAGAPPERGSPSGATSGACCSSFAAAPTAMSYALAIPGEASARARRLDSACF